MKKELNHEDTKARSGTCRADAAIQSTINELVLMSAARESSINRFVASWLRGLICF
jgi:hypothetical protein